MPSSVSDTSPTTNGGWTVGTSRSGDNGANWAGPPPRRYANHLAVEFSLSEFALQFGQHDPGQAEPVIHSIVVSSPVHVAMFCQEIRESILRYESRFGPIPGWHTDSSETRQ